MLFLNSELHKSNLNYFDNFEESLYELAYCRHTSLKISDKDNMYRITCLSRFVALIMRIFMRTGDLWILINNNMHLCVCFHPKRFKMKTK